MITFNCGYCGAEKEKAAGHYNRAKKLGHDVYCNRECSGLGHRGNKSDEQNKGGSIKIETKELKVTEQKFESIKELRKLMYALKGFSCVVTVRFDEGE